MRCFFSWAGWSNTHLWSQLLFRYTLLILTSWCVKTNKFERMTWRTRQHGLQTQGRIESQPSGYQTSWIGSLWVPPGIDGQHPLGIQLRTFFTNLPKGLHDNGGWGCSSCSKHVVNLSNNNSVSPLLLSSITMSTTQTTCLIQSTLKTNTWSYSAVMHSCRHNYSRWSSDSELPVPLVVWSYEFYSKIPWVCWWIYAYIYIDALRCTYT